jgi:predicted dithiol-disulfide oxidoreductase (DUF899 family)
MTSFPNESVEYRQARNRLLQQEMELRRITEAVAAARRALPPGGAVPQDYLFHGQGSDGKAAPVRLSELFASGRDSLVIYSMMFPRDPLDSSPGPPSGQTALLPLGEGPCPSCSALVDQLDGAAGHAAQRVNLAVVAKAPVERVLTFARERGWRRLRLLSSAGSSYNRDYLAETADGTQRPMLNVFHRDGNRSGTSGAPSCCTPPSLRGKNHATLARSNRCGTCSTLLRTVGELTGTSSSAIDDLSPPPKPSGRVGLVGYRTFHRAPYHIQRPTGTRAHWPEGGRLVALAILTNRRLAVRAL